MLYAYRAAVLEYSWFASPRVDPEDAEFMHRQIKRLRDSLRNAEDPEFSLRIWKGLEPASTECYYFREFGEILSVLKSEGWTKDVQAALSDSLQSTWHDHVFKMDSHVGVQVTRIRVL